jgi:hypothetical protein
MVARVGSLNPMAIIINLDVRLAQQKMRLNELADAVGITLSNLSILKSRQSQGHPFLHAGSDMRQAQMPTRGYIGVPQSQEDASKSNCCGRAKRIPSPKPWSRCS